MKSWERMKTEKKKKKRDALSGTSLFRNKAESNRLDSINMCKSLAGGIKKKKTQVSENRNQTKREKETKREVP